MRHLGRQVAPGSRRHAPQICPFHRLGRRSVFATYDRAQPIQPEAIGVSVPPSRARPVQLVWNQPQHQRRRQQDGGNGNERGPQPVGEATATASHDRSSAIVLMSLIKAARSWQQLHSIVDENYKSMNHLHVSAVVTHMAQLHTSSSSSSSNSGPSNVWNGGAGRDRGIYDHDHHDAAPAHVLNSLGRSDAASTTTTQSPPGASHAAHGASRPSHQPQPRHLQLLQQPLTPSASNGLQLAGRQLPGSTLPAQLPPPDQGLFLQRLERAVLAHLADFKGRQLANTLWAVAKVGHRPPQAWLDAVLARARPQLSTFEPQHLANTLYALMLMQFMPPTPWLVEFFAAVDQRLHGFGPAELAHLCYAAGKLRLQPGRKVLGGVLTHSMVHMESYGIRELTLLLYGVVHMGRSHHQAWMRRYRMRVTSLLIKAEALSPRVLERLMPRLNKPVAELANAHLRGRQQQLRQHQTLKGGEQQHFQDEWQQRALADDSSAAPRTSEAAVVSSYLPTMLLSMANMAYQPPPAFMEVVLEVVGSNARQLGSVSLTSLLLSLAYIQYRPQAHWFRSIWELVMESLDSLDTQQSANALWAASCVGCDVPRRDVHAILMQAAARLPAHTDAELLALMQAAASLGFEPRSEWLELMETHLYNRLPHMRPFEAAAALHRMADLGHKPHRVWLARWSEALLARVAELALQDVAVAGYAAARLGYRPPASLCSQLVSVAAERMAAAEDQTAASADARMVAAGERMAAVEDPTAASADARTVAAGEPQQQQEQEFEVPLGLQPARLCRSRNRDGVAGARCRGETLSRLLWALAMLDVRPSGDWMSSYMANLGSSLEDLNARELSLVVWALARLRYDPGQEWMEAFRERSGATDDLVAADTGVGADGSMTHAAGGALAGRKLAHGARSGRVLSPGTPDMAAARRFDGAVSPTSGGGGGAKRFVGDAWTRNGGGSMGSGLDFSVIILQGITAWAERQLGDGSAAAKQQAVGHR